MTISSRTPEGLPHQCPVCGKRAELEPSFPYEDSCCPHCGHLLLWIRDRISERYAVDPTGINLFTPLADLVDDSLGLVELIMDMEDQHQILISDEDYAQIQTVADVIRYLQNWRPGEPV